MTGIYKFENLINGNIYIGQAKDIARRYKDHITRANNDFQSNSEYNTPIHKAIRKYGIENFSFSIIEECEYSELNDKEIYWINYYNSYKNGYNQTSGGNQSEPSIKFDKEFVKIIQNLLINTELTYDEIHKQYNISTGRISEINTGKIWNDSSLIYPLRDRKKEAKIWYCQYCGDIVSKGENCCVKCSLFLRRKVKNRPEKQELKNLIRNNTFVDIGKKYNVSDNTIKKWCKRYNLPSRKKDIITYSNEEWEKI